MLKIGITGSNGLLGYHLRCFLHSREDVSVICAERSVFADEEAMDKFVSSIDVVVHLAYKNRGAEQEVEQLNPSLAERLIAACERAGNIRQIVFSSSTHIYRDSAYGRSKRKCSELFSEWAERNNVCFSNIIFPHVYGEFGQPFSNSVVSTFCYQMANGETPAIDHDGDLELLHAQDAASLVYQAVCDGMSGDIPATGIKIKVSEMLAQLGQMAGTYAKGVIPDLRNLFSLKLFNTYRSYLFPAHYPVSLTLHEDDRGALFEAVKSDNGGQTFLSTTRPGITRGNHYHYHKVERFLVVQGEAVIALRKLFSEQVIEFKVDGSSPQFIDIPTMYTHHIRNTGKNDLMTLFWSHEIFNPEAPDTIFEVV